MIPRRCNCGVHYHDRCPDRYKPGHYADDRMAPVWAFTFTVVGCALLAGAVFGAKMLLGLL